MSTQQNKSIKIISNIVFVIIFVMLVSVYPLAADKPIVINYSDSDPTTAMRSTFVKDVWLPEIEKQTHGKVKMQAFWGGSVLGHSEALKGVKDGVADMAFIFPDAFPKQLQAYQMFKLFPKVLSDWENTAWIYHKAFDEIPEFTAELEAWNQKLLLVVPGLTTGMFATYPVDSLEDFVGKKWRSPSRWHLEILKHIGAIPVSIPWADVYMALSTGTIEGTITNYDAGHMARLYEAAPNILVAPQLWWATPTLHTINLDKWNSLPEDVQEGIIRASEIAEEKLVEVVKNAFDSTVAEEKKAGCTVNFMSDADVEKFVDEEFLSELRNTWVKEAKEMGIKNAAYDLQRLKLIIEEGIERGKNN